MRSADVESAVVVVAVNSGVGAAAWSATSIAISPPLYAVGEFLRGSLKFVVVLFVFCFLQILREKEKGGIENPVFMTSELIDEIWIGGVIEEVLFDGSVLGIREMAEAFVADLIDAEAIGLLAGGAVPVRMRKESQSGPTVRVVVSRFPAPFFVDDRFVNRGA